MQLTQTLRVNMGLCYGDFLTRVRHRCRPYEAVAGSTDALWKKCVVCEPLLCWHSVGGVVYHYRTAIADDACRRAPRTLSSVGMYGASRPSYATSFGSGKRSRWSRKSARNRASALRA